MTKQKTMDIGTKADQATKTVWKKLVNERKKTGEPIISWKEGRVVYFSPYDMKEVDPVQAYAVCDKKSKYGKN